MINSSRNYHQMSIWIFFNAFMVFMMVAIGGINSNNYKNLLLNKANFLAISGYVWNNKNYKPKQAIEKLK